MMEFMDGQLYDIAYLIQFRDSRDTKVSKVPVVWHLDHILKVINRTYYILEKSDRTLHQKRFSWIRTHSFALRRISRGKEQSLASFLPPDIIKTEDLLLQLELARKNICDLKTLDEHSNFIHPVFGQLNKKQSKRFLEIHTKHHLKIVKDILKSDRKKYRSLDFSVEVYFF